MHISEVKTSAPFNELFDIKEEVVEAIAENMQGYGFDAARPIVLWADKKIVIDGHTRLEAARRAGIVQIYCREFPFRDEDTALAYAIHNQRNRRNITEAELLRCIEAVDKRREAERDDRGKFTVAPSGAPGKSAEATAKIVGTSPRKVERARNVLSDPEEKAAVITGKKSINKASRDNKAKRQPQPPVPVPTPAPPPNPEPIHISLVLTPAPEDEGYTMQIKELPWVAADRKTIIDCVAHVVGIFEDAGEQEILKELRSTL